MYATAGGRLLISSPRWSRGKFDPFAPVWLFLVGYIQVYVIQAISYHDWAVGARGKELVAAANLRAFWALALVSGRLSPAGSAEADRPRCCRPRRGAGRRHWSGCISPPLIVWGLFCAGLAVFGGAQIDSATISGEETLLSFVPVRDDGRGGPADRDRPDDRLRQAGVPARRVSVAALPTS